MPRPAGGSTAPSLLDPYMGDAWAVYYAFELQQGTDVERTDVSTGVCRPSLPTGSCGRQFSDTNTTEKRRLDKASILRKVIAAYVLPGNGAVVVIPRGRPNRH